MYGSISSVAWIWRFQFPDLSAAMNLFRIPIMSKYIIHSLLVGESKFTWVNWSSFCLIAFIIALPSKQDVLACSCWSSLIALQISLIQDDNSENASVSSPCSIVHDSNDSQRRRNIALSTLLSQLRCEHEPLRSSHQVANCTKEIHCCMESSHANDYISMLVSGSFEGPEQWPDHRWWHSALLHVSLRYQCSGWLTRPQRLDV